MNLDFELPASIENPIKDGHSSQFAQCEAFMRRELPGRVRGELEVRIERALVPVEESLKQQLVGIVQDLQVKLFEEFRHAYRQENSARTDESRIAAAGATAVVMPNDSSQMLYSPFIQDDKGQGKDAVLPCPDNDAMETSDFGSAWSVSQPMDIALSSYPFILDDPSALLGDVTQTGGNWDSRWTNAMYSNWK